MLNKIAVFTDPTGQHQAVLRYPNYNGGKGSPEARGTKILVDLANNPVVDKNGKLDVRTETDQEWFDRLMDTPPPIRNGVKFELAGYIDPGSLEEGHHMFKKARRWNGVSVKVDRAKARADELKKETNI